MAGNQATLVTAGGGAGTSERRDLEPRPEGKDSTEIADQWPAEESKKA